MGLTAAETLCTTEMLQDIKMSNVSLYSSQIHHHHHHHGLFQTKAHRTYTAMNNKTDRQTEYKRTETATKRQMHTMK